METDKVYHGLAGLFISMTVSLIWQSSILGLFVAAVIGALKEGLDWLVNLYYTRRGEAPRHDVDFWDFFWTCLGGAMGSMAVATFDTDIS